MKMTIGQQVSRMRREKGVTQEQLAAAVGVSAPAVSKWEAGQSCPDIALLMPLARYFGVTVDCLLGYQAQLSRDEADKLGKECQAVFAAQGWEAGMESCRRAARQYPQDAYLKYRLASAIQMSAIYAGSEEDWIQGTAQQEEWLKAGLGPDTPLDQTCRYMLGCLYAGRDEYDKAEEMLGELRQDAPDGRALMPSIYLGQGKLPEADKAAQQNMLAGLGQIQNAFMTRLAVAGRQEDWQAYGSLLEKIGQVAALFGMQGQYCVANCNCAITLAVKRGQWPQVVALVERLAGELDQTWEVPPLFDKVQFTDLHTWDAASPLRRAIRQGLAREYEQQEWAREHLAECPAWRQALDALRGEGKAKGQEARC